MVLLLGSVGMWSGRWGSHFGSPTEARVGSTDHANPSSTVGSSPGVVEKRILGVFSLRTSDNLEQFYCACGPPPMAGHLDHPVLPIHTNMEHPAPPREAGAISLPASSFTATRYVPARRLQARRSHPRTSGERFMHVTASELRRILLPRTPLNKISDLLFRAFLALTARLATTILARCSGV
jgi:hypothetical protein